MARRNLIDIDDKILDATIELGANAGIEGISAMKIAKICNISDALVFVHFKNMRNLILVSYEKVFKRTLDFLKKTYATPDFRGFEECWEEVISYHLSKPLDSRFIYNIMHSEYCSFDVKQKSVCFVELTRKVLKDLKITDKEVLIIFYQLVDSTLNYIIRILNGDIEFSKEFNSIMCKVIFGGVMK